VAEGVAENYPAQHMGSEADWPSEHSC
jgi:hypothetical protein